jgi:hypothetical protein
MNRLKPGKCYSRFGAKLLNIMWSYGAFAKNDGIAVVDFWSVK